ncbi:MAG: sigma-70 family RNA polymerase sigma factor [Planctomycetes bacterium]|nr:sigma-70 family RNA polymerase sigma factor [Planctomycetota bacterium]
MTHPEPRDGESRVLVDSASGGDRESLELLLTRMLPKLRAFVSVRVGTHLLARETPDDLVQSCCREVLEDLPTFEYRGEASFRKWLFLSALNKIRDRAAYHRRQKRDFDREVAQDDVGGSPAILSLLTPSRAAAGREELARVESAFRSLPADYQSVLVMSRIAGLDHATIAEELERTPGAVKVLLHRATARLGRLIAESETP